MAGGGHSRGRFPIIEVGCDSRMQIPDLRGGSRSCSVQLSTVALGIDPDSHLRFVYSALPMRASPSQSRFWFFLQLNFDWYSNRKLPPRTVVFSRLGSWGLKSETCGFLLRFFPLLAVCPKTSYMNFYLSHLQNGELFPCGDFYKDDPVLAGVA